MTLSKFVSKWKGKPVDFDGHYGPQCMDLMHQYILEMYELPGSVLQAPTAKKAFDIGHPKFEKFEKDKTDELPQPGDIVFWSDDYVVGTGHVAIFLESGADGFISFDQNWPLGSLCNERGHSYNGVVGWLRYKNSSNKKMINFLKNRRMVWIKAPGETTAEFWIIRTNENHPKETRHKVGKGLKELVPLFGEFDKLERATWPDIVGLTEGKEFNLRNAIITHPELFES